MDLGCLSIVSALLVIQGLSVAAYILLFPSTQAGDFQAFYFAARRVLENEAFVGRPPPTGVDTAWVFAPIVVLYFVPFALLPSWQLAYVTQVVVIGALLAYLVIQIHRRYDFGPVEPLVLAAISLNPYTVLTVAQGQMNVHVLVLILSGIWLVDDGLPLRGGIALGGAAIVKIWPALLGWWLVYRRETRAVLTALATGIGGLIAGVLLFGLSPTIDWFTRVLVDRSYAGSVESMGPDSRIIGLERFFANTLPGAESWVYTVGTAVLVFGLLVGVFYHTPRRRTIPVAGSVVCATLLALPSSTIPYLIIPVTTALIVLRGRLDARVTWLLAGGVVIAGVPVGFEEVRVLANVAGMTIRDGGFLSTYFALAPPALVGSVLLTAGHFLAAVRRAPDRYPR